MCRRLDVDERRLVAAETNTAIALDELDVSRVTLGAVDTTKRALQKAVRAGQISRPLATMLMRGLDVIQGGTERGRALDEADYRHGLVLTGMCLEKKAPVGAGARSAA